MKKFPQSAQRPDNIGITKTTALFKKVICGLSDPLVVFVGNTGFNGKCIPFLSPDSGIFPGVIKPDICKNEPAHRHI